MTSKKNVQFFHPPPSPLPFSVCPKGSELGEILPPLDVETWATNHPPPPSPLVFLQKIGMLKRKPKCCLKCSFLQSQTPSVWNTYSRIKHLSGTIIAEPDTSLEHLQQNQTPIWTTVWTLITLILIIAVDIQFLWIPFPLVFIHFRLNFYHFLPDSSSPHLLDVINVCSLKNFQKN